MPIVQAAVVRAVSVMGDGPGIFTLVAVVQTFAQRLGAIRRMQLRTGLLLRASGYRRRISGPSRKSHSTAAANDSDRLDPCSRTRMSRFATTLRGASVAGGY
jgi:hypothetical protein